MSKTETLLLVQAGSHAYGLATPDSDHDTRGVYALPTTAYIYGLTRAKPLKSPDEDRVLWDLRQFMSLAAGANTQALEVLFVPGKHILERNEVGMLLRRQRHLFLTKALFRVVTGYALSEYRQAVGEGKRKLGAQRKADIARYGYSPKNASHCLRLLGAGIIALETHEFPVHIDDPDERRFLLRLKQGELTRDHFEGAFVQRDQRLKAAHEASELPEQVDREAVNALTVRCLEMLRARGVFDEPQPN